MTARARRIRDLVGGLALGLVVAGCAAEPLPPPPMLPDLKWEAQLEHVLVVELVVQNEQTTEVLAVYSWESRRRSV